MAEFVNKSGIEPEGDLWMKRAALFPRATVTPFAAFNNRHAGGMCWVVGRGPTDFVFSELAGVKEPIFFINDAVGLEKLARSETYFFAHDARMRVWLDGGIRATAVLPVDGKVFPENQAVLNHAGGMVFYRWPEADAEPLLCLDRDGLAAAATLYRNCATIHSLLHFVWFCGFQRVKFIGCDGINDRELLGAAYRAPTGYDARIENRSRTTPWWRYDDIRRVQEILGARLGLTMEYVGTPRPSGFAATRKFILFEPGK